MSKVHVVRELRGQKQYQKSNHPINEFMRY